MTQLYEYIGMSDRYISGTAEFNVYVFAGTIITVQYLRVMEAVLPLRHILLKTKETGSSETSYSMFSITIAARASYFVWESFNQEGNY